MAKDAKPAPAEGEAPKKSKKLLIIILAVVLLLLVAGAGAAFLLLSGGGDHEDEEEVAQEVKKPKKKKAEAGVPPVFVNLDAFTVNLVPEQGGDQYMQVVMALELEDMTADPILKGQMPRIRNNLTMILSSKKASELLTKEGKEELAKEIKDEINSILDPSAKGKAPEGPVLSVLFTSFIIQ